MTERVVRCESHRRAGRQQPAVTERFDRGHLDLQPSRRLAIVTCMDSRIDVFTALGGDGEAPVLQNAGGLIAVDVMRSLAISQRRRGTGAIPRVRRSPFQLHRDRVRDVFYDTDSGVLREVPPSP